MKSKSILEVEQLIMPYIPKEHLKYEVLPRCRKSGREVFSYPGSLLDEANQYVEGEDLLDPYGFHSYEEYLPKKKAGIR